MLHVHKKLLWEPEHFAALTKSGINARIAAVKAIQIKNSSHTRQSVMRMSGDPSVVRGTCLTNVPLIYLLRLSYTAVL